MKTIKGNYHPYKDWVMDKKGYFLIRIDEKMKKLEVGYCTSLPKKGKHAIKFKITGKTPQEVYFTIAKTGMVSRFDHAAYLGKELEKAYIAIQLGLKYVQDDELVKNVERESQKNKGRILKKGKNK